MRFIHTSDWHLGRQFHNASLLDDQRHVLMQILAHLQTEQADALVIAGDIYDRSVPPAAAVELLDDILHRVCNELGIPVILIPGNHDSAGRLGFASRQLRRSGLHIISALDRIDEPVQIKGVNFFAIPYADPEQVRNHYGSAIKTHDQAHARLLQQIDAVRDPDAVNVLISHCFVDGAETSESERPLAIGGAERVDYRPLLAFDYVALGHLHSPQYRGAEYIRYSGSILKYSFSECRQRKGVTLVELDDNGFRLQRRLPLQAMRDMRVLEGELADLLHQGKTDPHNEDYLLVRLSDGHAILDPMGKLREIYPNVLHLEKPGLMEGLGRPLQQQRLQRGELSLFQDFFAQVTGRELSQQQQTAIKAVIEQLHKEEQA